MTRRSIASGYHDSECHERAERNDRRNRVRGRKLRACDDVLRHVRVGDLVVRRARDPFLQLASDAYHALAHWSEEVPRIARSADPVCAVGFMRTVPWTTRPAWGERPACSVNHSARRPRAPTVRNPSRAWIAALGEAAKRNSTQPAAVRSRTRCPRGGRAIRGGASASAVHRRCCPTGSS